MHSHAYRILHTLYRLENISGSYGPTSRGIAIGRQQHFAEIQTGFREYSQSLKSLPNYTRIRTTRVKGEITTHADNDDLWVYEITIVNSNRCDDIKYRRRIGNSREEIVNFLLVLISEANHLELLRRPTNHFQPDRRQFQYISRDYKHSEGLINFALSHRPYPWASY